jgi:MFS family permease
LLNAFGVYQEYYSTVLLSSTSDSTISWIGSINAFLICTTTMFAGPLFDVGYGRPLVFGGTFFVVFGLMMTSLGSAYWQLVLAQGICIGMGAGALFIVSVAIIPGYFTTRRALAIGVAASGSSLGGIIYPITFHYLEPTIGFGWATRVIGFSSSPARSSNPGRSQTQPNAARSSTFPASESYRSTCFASLHWSASADSTFPSSTSRNSHLAPVSTRHYRSTCSLYSQQAASSAESCQDN